MRHFRRRSRPQRTITRTYKKVLNFAPASHAAGLAVNNIIVQGVDSATLGQTGATDGTVPTGAIVEEVIIQYGVANLAAVACFHHFCIQYVVGSQSLFVPPNLVGGNNQRNQVLLQGMSSIGQGQNKQINLRYKIPRRFQRIKEAEQIVFSILGTTAITDSLQIIYIVKM